MVYLKWQVKKFLTAIATNYIIKNFKHLIGDGVSASDLFSFIEYDLNSKPAKASKQKIDKLFN